VDGADGKQPQGGLAGDDGRCVGLGFRWPARRVWGVGVRADMKSQGEGVSHLCYALSKTLQYVLDDTYVHD
jgi:hypothetical protein